MGHRFLIMNYQLFASECHENAEKLLPAEIKKKLYPSGQETLVRSTPGNKKKQTTTLKLVLRLPLPTLSDGLGLMV